MPEDSLSALESRVEKLLEIVTRFKEEEKRWEKEKADLKAKIEEILERVGKVMGDEA